MELPTRTYAPDVWLSTCFTCLREVFVQAIGNVRMRCVLFVVAETFVGAQQAQHEGDTARSVF
jgi:hypothetical protein